MPAPWLAVLASALAKKQQDAQTREDAASQIQQRYAAQLGAPTAEMEAAQVNKGLREQEGPDYLSAILPLFNKKKAQGGGGMLDPWG